jgi:K+-transporting ATPase ATPase A chain
LDCRIGVFGFANIPVPGFAFAGTFWIRLFTRRYMTLFGILQISFYLVILFLLVKPLGSYMARVYEGKSVFLDHLLRPVERLIYRVAGINPDQEMDWKAYAAAMLLFNMLGILILYGLLRLQSVLPLNPQGFEALSPDLALNTAVSFGSNTNWQNYGGEFTLSYLTQMLGMTVQNFVSAGTGMAVLVALIRGIVRNSARTIGNYWVDLTRSVLYILLPLSLLLSLVLVSQGVVQTFRESQLVTLLQPTTQPDGQVVEIQTLAVGPVASQIAIKQLGTNGGGFFNTNSSHPFENPTPLTNLF